MLFLSPSIRGSFEVSLESDVVLRSSIITFRCLIFVHLVAHLFVFPLVLERFFLCENLYSQCYLFGFCQGISHFCLSISSPLSFESRLGFSLHPKRVASQ